MRAKSPRGSSCSDLARRVFVQRPLLGSWGVLQNVWTLPGPLTPISCLSSRDISLQSIRGLGTLPQTFLGLGCRKAHLVSHCEAPPPLALLL